MEELHGVLMHGDDELGHDHGKEDSDKLAAEAEANKQDQPTGPCTGA